MTSTPPARRARRRRLRTWPWWGMAWALVTLVLAGIAFQQLTAQPRHPVTFRIQQDLTTPAPALGNLNITQETVDRMAEQYGLLTYEPMTFEVVDQVFTWREQDAGLPTSVVDPAGAPAADVVLSVGDPELFKAFALPPDSPVVVNRDFEDSIERHRVSTAIAEAFHRNMTAGHGPGAVVAAAETAAARLQPRPMPLPWVAAAGGSLAITLLTFMVWFRRRSADEARRRTLATAQQRLARVVLDQEALDATYRAVDQEALPASVRKTWTRLESMTRSLLKRQPDVEAEVLSGKRFSRAPDAVQTAAERRQDPLTRFSQDAQELSALAAVLMESVAVHGRFSGAARPLEQLLAPIHAAVRELQERVEPVLSAVPWTGPAGLTTADRAALSSLLGEVLEAHQELLAIVQEPAGAASADAATLAATDTLARWQRAEQRISEAAGQITERLRTQRGQAALKKRVLRRLSREQVARRLDALAPGYESGLTPHRERVRLRQALGLPSEWTERPLDAVEAACVMARIRLGFQASLDRGGDPLSTRQVRTEDVEGTDVTAGWARTRSVEGRQPSRHVRTTLLMTAVVLVGLLAGWAAVQSLDRRTPFMELVGEEQLSGLSIDDRTGDRLGLTEEGLRQHLEDRFTEPVHITYAVRNLSDYVTARLKPGGVDRLQLDYEDAVDLQWRLKAELPDLVDPQTREVLPDQVIIPVLLYPGERYLTLPEIVGVLSVGDDPRLGAYDFELTEPRLWNFEDARILTYDMEAVSRALQANAHYADQTNPGLLFWSVLAAVVLMGLVLLQVLSWIGRTAAGLDRSGRHGKRLREIARRADLLAADLDDSRQFAVAVGEPTEEVGQRLFDRTLVLALREVEAQRMVPRAERTGQEFAVRVDVLDRRVRLLEQWDADTTRRTETLLAAARERW